MLLTKKELEAPFRFSGEAKSVPTVKNPVPRNDRHFKSVFFMLGYNLHYLITMNALHQSC